MKSMKTLPAALALALFALNPAAHADTLVLTGPELVNENIGWPDTGLQITAIQSVVLQSFSFANIGGADVISLTDSSNNVLHTMNFSAGNAGVVTINADWALTAGQTYHLISEQPSNSWWNYANFPMANAHISVDSGYGFESQQPLYWFRFNDLTTVSAVPEPATYAMFLAGLTAAVLARRRRTL
ncbi:PEP-CTERM sorting domain-containing protein [Pseudoduganella sp. FT55W]|uniref:PEP-CTERM sorting domain-containing protein n=1 Tax=Duganella rivi TaxID=2666083 RepID=A0A7X4GS15_9BURK|nr:PEP-CTERM sorting domain-containing protein [Duganella rivi]MYM68640.1 PEP-CTERM sorting domain-containing protein [Duganella rivi]